MSRQRVDETEALARVARGPLEMFAAGVRQALEPAAPAAADVVEAGLLAADTFGPTLAAVRQHASDVQDAVPIAVGKAAAPMALAWSAAGGQPGLLITPRGFPVSLALDAWELIPAEHPIAGAGSLRAGQRALEVARSGRPVFLLLSGGASALMESPVLPPAEHERAVRALHALSLPIQALNAARSLLSRIKAGGLAAAAEGAGSPLTVYYASDVPGDDPTVVGSGPGARITLETLTERLGPLPPAARASLDHVGASRDWPSRAAAHHLVLPRKAPALAMAARAHELGLTAHMLDPLDGPVEDAAARVAREALTLANDDVAILWGEPTVAAPPDATDGGRTSHLLAALWMGLRASTPHTAAMVATDGIDGPLPIGGCWFRGSGVPPTEILRRALDRFATARAFQSLDPARGGLFPDSPTCANSADVGVLTSAL